jgi:hypothetical protein
LYADDASLELPYWSTEIVTFFEPSPFSYITILVALGLPVAVAFPPVLASLMISGKSRVTSLSGTMTLRGSVPLDVTGAEKLSHTSERIPTIAIDNAASRPGRDPPPMSPQSSRSVRPLRCMHQRIMALAAARAFNQHPAVRSIISSARASNVARNGCALQIAHRIVSPVNSPS